jgi:hypothetical protein
MGMWAQSQTETAIPESVRQHLESESG